MTAGIHVMTMMRKTGYLRTTITNLMNIEDFSYTSEKCIGICIKSGLKLIRFVFY